MLRTNMVRDRLKLPALPLTAATARRVAELVLRTFADKIVRQFYGAMDLRIYIGCPLYEDRRLNLGPS